MIETIITSNLLFKNFGSFKILKGKKELEEIQKQKKFIL